MLLELTPGGVPLDGERRRLAAAFALTVVLHAALLLQASAGATRAAPGAAPVLSVRMVPAADAGLAMAGSEPAPRSVDPTPEPPAVVKAATTGRTASPTPSSPAAAAGSRSTATSIAAASPTEPAALRPAAPPDLAPPVPEVRDVALAPAYPPLPAAPGYVLSGRLDPGPRPLDDIAPDYPDGTHSRSGNVVVRILVAANGNLDDVAVVQATPPGLFDRAALEAIRRVRFAPGLLLGVPVKSQITIEIGFAEINRGPTVSGRGY